MAAAHVDSSVFGVTLTHTQKCIFFPRILTTVHKTKSDSPPAA
jgi:hypothetical protein